jgi:hypothetical protein
VVRAHPTVPIKSITYLKLAEPYSSRGNNRGSNSQVLLKKFLTDEIAVRNWPLKEQFLSQFCPGSQTVNRPSEHQTTNLGVRSSNLFGRAPDDVVANRTYYVFTFSIGLGASARPRDRMVIWGYKIEVLITYA